MHQNALGGFNYPALLFTELAYMIHKIGLRVTLRAFQMVIRLHNTLTVSMGIENV